MPQPVLDLRKFHWKQDHGGLTFIGTWYRTDGGRMRPCMVIIRAGDERNHACKPYIIPLDNSWIWSEEVGDGAACAESCLEIAKTLRFEPDPRSMIEVRGWIADHLGDLVGMPPYRHDNEIVADLLMTSHATGKTIAIEMRGDV